MKGYGGHYEDRLDGMSQPVLKICICSGQGGGSKSRAFISLIQCNTLVKPAVCWPMSFVFLYRLANVLLGACKRNLKLNVGFMNCSTCDRRCENKRSKHVLRPNDILHYI